MSEVMTNMIGVVLGNPVITTALNSLTSTQSTSSLEWTDSVGSVHKHSTFVHCHHAHSWCKFDGDCCSGKCESGRCASEIPLKYAGEACTDNTQCDSLFCKSENTDHTYGDVSKRCGTGDSCKRKKKHCNFDYDCCEGLTCDWKPGKREGVCSGSESHVPQEHVSDLVDRDITSEPLYWLKNCTKPQQSCTSDGECCSEICSGPSLAEQVTTENPGTCYNLPDYITDPSYVCKVAGQDCVENYDCCTDHCKSENSDHMFSMYVKFCTDPNTCKKEKYSCKYDYECCPSLECRWFGEEDHGICTKYNAPSQHVQACQGMKSPCSASPEFDCCDGLYCSYTSGNFEGTCVDRNTTQSSIKSCEKFQGHYKMDDECCGSLICNTLPGMSEGFCDGPKPAPKRQDACKIDGEDCTHNDECCLPKCVFPKSKDGEVVLKGQCLQGPQRQEVKLEHPQICKLDGDRCIDDDECCYPQCMYPDGENVEHGFCVGPWVQDKSNALPPPGLPTNVCRVKGMECEKDSDCCESTCAQLGDDETP